MTIKVELINCVLKVRRIGTREEIDLHDWCYSKKVNSDPVAPRGRSNSKSPKKKSIERRIYYVSSILQKL